LCLISLSIILFLFIMPLILGNDVIIGDNDKLGSSSFYEILCKLKLSLIFNSVNYFRVI
jgi:hypothetical protein